MKKKLLIFKVFIITIFLAIFLTHELGTMGRLPPSFRKFYSELVRLPAFFTDLKFKIRGKRKPKNPIAIVAIDSPSIEEIGRWPWRRDIMARLTMRLFQLGAKVVGFDVLFSEPEHLIPEELAELLIEKKMADWVHAFDTDSKFERIIERYKSRVVVSWVSESPCQPRLSHASECPVTEERAIATYPEEFDRLSISAWDPGANFDPQKTPIVSMVTVIPVHERLSRESFHQGFANSFADADGTVRKATLIAMAKGKPHPSLPLAMASILSERPTIKFGAHSELTELRLGESNNPLPVTAAGTMAINFRGPEGSFPYISARDVLGELDTESRKKMRSQIEGKAILVGSSAAALADVKNTPFELLIPGVEIHANILDNILSRDMMITPTAEKYPLIVLTILGLLMTGGVTGLVVWLERLNALKGIMVLGGSSVGIFAFDAGILFPLNRNWPFAFFYLEMAVVTLVTLAEKYIFEEFAKKKAQTITLLKEKELLQEQLVRTRMEDELKTAQIVQNTILTSTKISHPDIELTHYYTPAAECGGDLWEARVKDRKLTAFIADATGHGAGAAIVTAVAKSCFITIEKLLKGGVPPPAESLRVLNEIIYSTCREKLFMTMCFLQLDLDTGSIVFANAGHESPLCLRLQKDQTARQSIESLFSRGERLGFDLNSAFQTETFQLAAGDTLLLYTDGLSEAINSEGKEWGERSLKKAFRNLSTCSVTEVRDGIMKELNNFTGKTPLKDDITFLVLRWKGKHGAHPGTDV